MDGIILEEAEIYGRDATAMCRLRREGTAGEDFSFFPDPRSPSIRSQPFAFSYFRATSLFEPITTVLLPRLTPSAKASPQ